MLQISPPQLSDDDLRTLADLQNFIDQEPIYAERVARATTSFDRKPRALFARVRGALSASSGDLVRCGYCEDSCADEVEHIWPKTFFPGRTFLPENYLFACGICNPAKRDKFTLLVDQTWIDLVLHRRTRGVVECSGTVSGFIDPIRESPLSLIWLDITGRTFHFTPIHDEGTREWERASFTIDTLRLNREVLVVARRNAYTGFIDRIHRYIDRKDAGDDPARLSERLAELRRAPHQTVRHEIARQASLIGDLDERVKRTAEVFE